jgi:hypothetical protein
MNKTVLAALMLFAFASTAQADQDRCESWTHKAYPVTLEACSYKDGSSGYYKITNNGYNTADICWSVVSNSGKKDKGCHSRMPAGETERGVCVQCGSKNEGVQYILLESYKVSK